jgi:hypothetical protein
MTASIRYLEYSGYTPTGKPSHKVWAQAWNQNGANSTYATFWGPFSGPYQHKTHTLHSADMAARVITECNAKLSDSYKLHAPLYEFRKYVEKIADQFDKLEINNLTIDQINSIAKANAQPVVALSGAEQHCNFCQVYSQHELGTVQRLAWNETKCAYCKLRAGQHTPQHPHDAGSCPAFSWLPEPVANEKPTCDFCSGVKSISGSSRTQWFANSCQCGAPRVLHAVLHPHGRGTQCSGFSLKTAECNFCSKLNDLKGSERDAWLADMCTCAKSRGRHAGVHPHRFSPSCQAFSLASNCELCAAQKNDPVDNEQLMLAICECGVKAGVHGWEHPHHNFGCSGFSRRPLPVEATAQPNAPELPLLDLPCDCGHWLNVHATPGTLRMCLLATCKCEFYKRTCTECGLLTRTGWRHTANCVRGKFERKGKEVEQTRAPRRISHLLNEL